MANGINRANTSTPTPSNLMIVWCRRPKGGCDFGNGGGACVSGTPENEQLSSIPQ